MTENWLDIIKVIIFSALPVVEIRGGLPLAVLLGFSKRWAFFYGVLGNTLGLVLAFFILDYLMPWLLKVDILRRIYSWSSSRVERKRGRYVRLRYWALFLLVAIPLPGTGAWTAALASYLLKFDRRRAFIVIFLGILAVGTIILSAGMLTFHGIRHIL